MGDSPNLTYGFINTLSQLDFVEEVYLFGSRARGDNDPKSDIDIAIACPNATKEQWQQILEIIENADTLLKIDCIRYDTIANLKLKAAIDAEKINLCKKSNQKFNESPN